MYRRSEAEAPARVEELRHAKEEGIEFCFLHAPVEILIDDNGDVRGMRAQQMMLGDPDARGRRSPVPLDVFVEWDCDTVIYALGTRANPIIGQATRDLALDRRGYIVADEATQSTNLPGVFAGGDIVTGGATVILAMAAGRRGARAIGAWLAGGKAAWPVTTAEVDGFGQPFASARAGLSEGASMQCPKCHQPLADEDDEPYICCAGAPIEWQCQQCGKVSEGFAFPYGRCGQCGGRPRAA